jgi:hypothetical protein
LCYLPAKAEHFFLANLINERFEYERALPDLYEPVLVVLGHSVLVLRGFERIGEGDCLLLGGLVFLARRGPIADTSTAVEKRFLRKSQPSHPENTPASNGDASRAFFFYD